jgi:protein YIPF5/7
MTSRQTPSSDDFFRSELNAGPPPRLSAATTVRQSRPPPPPPPKKPATTLPALTSKATTGTSTVSTGSTTTATRPRPNATGIASSTTHARPTYVSNRAVGSSTVSSTTATTTTTSSSSGAESSILNSTATGSRKAPIMSRPVGNYYGNTPDPAAHTPASSEWDWGTPAKADTTDWSHTGGTTQAGEGLTSKMKASTTDWYSGNNISHDNAPAPTMSTAAPGPYAAPGFSNSASSSTAGASSTFYPFNQPMQQQSSSQHQQQQLLQPMQAGTGFYHTPAQTQQEQQQPFLSGTMDSSAPAMMNYDVDGMLNTSSVSMFTPKAQYSDQLDNIDYTLLDEAPLLEELGVNIEHILLKTKAVVLPFSRFGGNALDPEVICRDADLAGPIAFALLLGAEMIFSGKLQFGYIYGFGLFGCIAMTFVVNLVAPQNPISFWTVTSILGYALLPVNLLAFAKIFVINLINLQTLGRLLGILTVAWSTTASTRLFELGCQLRSQRYLIAYPIALLYSAFVLITIF